MQRWRRRRSSCRRRDRRGTGGRCRRRSPPCRTPWWRRSRVRRARPRGDVAGRQVQREVEDLQAEIVGEADLVDRRAAGRAKLDRARRRLDRPRRDALRDDAVIAGEDRDQRTVGRRRRTARPFGKPGGDVLHAAERTDRLFRPGKERPHPVGGASSPPGNACIRPRKSSKGSALVMEMPVDRKLQAA